VHNVAQLTLKKPIKMKDLINLLGEVPYLSVSGGFILCLVGMVLFKNEVKKYLIKKYDLYDREQIANAVDEAQKIIKFRQESTSKTMKTSEAVTNPNIGQLIFKNLQRKK
jgi:hypothetical protein